MSVCAAVRNAQEPGFVPDADADHSWKEALLASQTLGERVVPKWVPSAYSKSQHCTGKSSSYQGRSFCHCIQCAQIDQARGFAEIRGATEAVIRLRAVLHKLQQVVPSRCMSFCGYISKVCAFHKHVAPRDRSGTTVNVRIRRAHVDPPPSIVRKYEVRTWKSILIHPANVDHT